jgi:hypothetical protein
MRRAADAIGRRIFGANWTGDEFEAALIPQVIGISSPSEIYARSLLAEHSPERPLPPPKRLPEPIRPLGERRGVRLSEFARDRLPPVRSDTPSLSGDDFKAADEIAARLNERAENALERRNILFDRLVADAEAGQLVVSTFDERSDLSDMPANWWRSRYAHDWLQALQMEPGRRFERPSRSFSEFLYSGFAWLYVRRDRLGGYLGSIAAAEREAWWPGESESLKAWLRHDAVFVELRARLADVANPTRQLEAEILASMALEGGRVWKPRSIETTRSGHSN